MTAIIIGFMIQHWKQHDFIIKIGKQSSVATKYHFSKEYVIIWRSNNKNIYTVGFIYKRIHTQRKMMGKYFKYHLKLCRNGDEHNLGLCK